MDCKTIGATIMGLRKKCGWTQCELAKRLDVTDKAISRWESGQGYPDITILPRLAEAFDVSIDYLMLGERKGIAIVGNMLLDIIKTISDYPKSGMLAFTTDISYAVGGCVPNTAINLAKIDPTLPISAIGKLGTDENGRFVLSQLQRNGVNVNKISFSTTTPTSFSDVMSVPSGERTFFHHKGANSDFSPEDIDLDSLNCDLLHIGYPLLLDRFDERDAEYGTVMARFLHDVQTRGIKTSLDTVSDSTPRFSETVIPALRYCNYVIINEIECCNIWGLEARRKDDSLNRENLIEAMKKTLDAGVRDRVIVHCKERSFIMDPEKRVLEVPSLRIPKELIKGSVGAGDAFCAGCLYGIFNNYGDKQILEFASSAAACNLFAANSVDGMKNKNEILKMEKIYGRLSE